MSHKHTAYFKFGNNKKDEKTNNDVKVIIPGTTKYVMNGILNNCEKLYMRKEPNINSEPMSILTKESLIEVNLSNNDITDFYEVLVDGNKGYCMKKYIKLS